MKPDYQNALDNVSMEDLQNLARVISMEHANVPTFTVDSKQRFGQFFKRAGSFFNAMKLPFLAGVKLFSADMDSFVGKVGFVDAGNKNVIVPEGFVGLWLPYSALLNEAMGRAVKTEYMIRCFNETLGQLTNDPVLLESASGIGYTGPTDLGLTATMQDIGKNYFDGNSNNITRTLGACVERGADIRSVHNNINDAIAKDKAHPAAKSLAAVQRSMELSEKLMPYIEGNARISKGAVQELIDITLQIAKEMESYGVLLFRIRQFSEALKDSVKELKK
ncbi:hypothetical protein D3C76_926300 [compost metagenome]